MKEEKLPVELEAFTFILYCGYSTELLTVLGTRLPHVFIILVALTLLCFVMSMSSLLICITRFSGKTSNFILGRLLVEQGKEPLHKLQGVVHSSFTTSVMHLHHFNPY